MVIRPRNQAIGHWQPNNTPRGVTAHNYIALM